MAEIQDLTKGMMMARSSSSDIEACMALAGLLNALADGYFNDEDWSPFDQDDGDDCRKAIARILELHDCGSMLRVVWGMATLCRPENAVIDPDADVLRLHPSLWRRELATDDAEEAPNG